MSLYNHSFIADSQSQYVDHALSPFVCLIIDHGNPACKPTPQNITAENILMKYHVSDGGIHYQQLVVSNVVLSSCAPARKETDQWIYLYYSSRQANHNKE